MKTKLLLIFSLLCTLNTFAQITFEDHTIIHTTASIEGARSVHPADIDNDGDWDILSASDSDNKIAWYKIIWYEHKALVSTKPVKNSFEINLRLFPNPTAGILTINAPTSIVEIEIYNRLGQLVLSNTGEVNIDISHLASGLYFCCVKDKNGSFGIRKVVKE